MRETLVLLHGSASGASSWRPVMQGLRDSGALPPTTILVGERTLVAAVATARQLQHALSARMLQVPGAAHMIPVTHAAQVVAALEHGPTP